MDRFQKLVAEAKAHIREITPEDAAKQAAEGALLLDVREAEDFVAGHAKGAVPLSRGIVELEIEEKAPDLATPILCYCGGGSRSALTAESLQKMGYTNVQSITGGFRAWRAAGLPIEQ
jgi:rhodanese-related sulfurtransferase